MTHSTATVKGGRTPDVVAIKAGEMAQSIGPQQKNTVTRHFAMTWLMSAHVENVVTRNTRACSYNHFRVRINVGLERDNEMQRAASLFIGNKETSPTISASANNTLHTELQDHGYWRHIYRSMQSPYGIYIYLCMSIRISFKRDDEVERSASLFIGRAELPRHAASASTSDAKTCRGFHEGVTRGNVNAYAYAVSKQLHTWVRSNPQGCAVHIAIYLSMHAYIYIYVYLSIYISIDLSLSTYIPLSIYIYIAAWLFIGRAELPRHAARASPSDAKTCRGLH